MADQFLWCLWAAEAILPSSSAAWPASAQLRSLTKDQSTWLALHVMALGSPFWLTLSPHLSPIPYPSSFKSEEGIGKCSLDTVLSFMGLRLQWKGAAAPISLRNRVLYKLSLVQQKASRVGTSKQLWRPACRARGGQRDLFYPFSVSYRQISAHAPVSFHNALQMICCLAELPDLLLLCKVVCSRATILQKVSHLTLLPNTPLSQWYSFLSYSLNSHRFIFFLFFTIPLALHISPM